jgi:molecular chaperone GrpE
MTAKTRKKKTEPQPQVPAEETAEQTEEETQPKDQEPRDLEAQLQAVQDQYLRAKAELENARKRMQRESSELRQYTKASTIQEFFTVLDHFQMAMDHVDQTPDFETLKLGMNMILGEFRRTFENLGVEPINAAGEEFDPNQHEAVAQEPSDEVPKDHVLRQWKCGYRMGERLLRPASVIVSSGPESESKSDDKAD